VKRYRIATFIALGVLFPAASATAWWQWYHQDIPYAPWSGMWWFQNAPQGVVPGRMQPWSWQYQSVPDGPTSMWSSTTPISSLFVAQSHTPMGYRIRVHTGRPGTQDIEVGLEGHALVIKKREMSHTSPGTPIQIQQTGWSTQWVSLPADANVTALRITRGNGLVEIFVPRVR
jgi:hypothetical protein